MHIFGSGPPLVLIPGLDGHWSWMRPAIDVLSRRFRVITFSLCGERDCAYPLDESRGFEALLAQTQSALDEAGVEQATFCGVSYGGWIALRYAVEHPDRVTTLVLTSTPPPGFQLNALQQRYLSAPRRYAPAFVLTSPGRVLPEIHAALPTWGARARFLWRHGSSVARTGTSPTRMAARMRMAAQVDFFDVCRRVTTPTLIVTGEPGLDRVVPAEATRRYVTLIPGARHVTMRGTGHIGCLTQPSVFADAVTSFVDEATARGGASLDTAVTGLLAVATATVARDIDGGDGDGGNGNGNEARRPLATN